MSTNILMPALSPTMTEGKLSRWLKKEGEEIKSGDVLAEIETDKATMEVEAVDEGFLAKIIVQDGTEGVAVNAVIGVMTETKGGAVEAPKAPAKPEPKAPVTPKAEPAAPEAPKAAPPAPKTAEADRIFASPLARRMAKQSGIDLSTLKGSGPNGRIVVADLSANGAPAAAPAPAKPATPAAGGAEDMFAGMAHRKVPNSSMRKVIARRLTEVQQSVPHFFMTAHIEIDTLLKLRAELNATSPKDGPGAFKLSVNDLVIKACALALRRHPQVNASYTEAAMILYDDVDISVAVAIPEGLITPIIRKADVQGLPAISRTMQDLGARAKAGKLKPDEYQGGGFSISNLGMYGIAEFTAIINPPQAAILAVGAGVPRAVVKDGALAMATMMSMTLTCDHRVMDGALAAQFMATLKGLLEAPLGLLL